MRLFNKKKEETHRYNFKLYTEDGAVEYYNPFINFLAYGGMGCGKTKSIGKPLLYEYLRHNFAGLIYDFKDFDFTKTAYNLLMEAKGLEEYPYSFHVMNFAKPEYSERTNPISPKVIQDENLFIQLIDDMLQAYITKDGGGGKGSDPTWMNGALGLFQGVSYRFYRDYPQFCTLPHIILFCTQTNTKRLTDFLNKDPQCRGLAGAFLQSAKSPKTQASYQSNLANYISSLSFNKNILYLLSGEDYEFNLIDPEKPKLVSMCNSYQIDKIISPVIALMLGVSTRQFTMENKVPCFYLLDEATTFKISNFQNLCSVLREYLCSFTFLTQSSSKIEHMYSPTERSIIEANFGNHFYGRTTDVKAIEKYPVIFGKEEKEKISKTRGSSGERHNRSRTISSQKEDRYEPELFTRLSPGQFVCSAAESNKKKFIGQFELFDFEETLPIPLFREGDIKKEVTENYDKMLHEINLLL